MVLLRGKKLLVVVVALAFAVVIGVGIFIFVIKDKPESSSSQPQEYEEVEKKLADSLANNQKVIEQYQSEQAKITEQYIESIKSLDNLKELDISEQDRVGIAIINNLINNQKTMEAQTYIDYVMTFKTGFGLEASKICHFTAENSVRKSECLEIMTTRAVEQGIIAPGERLPSSYYDPENQHVTG